MAADDAPRTASSGRDGTAARPAFGRDAARPGSAGDGPAVRIEGLAKDYVHPLTLRRTTGLHALDLEVRRGEVFGYLGPNGAGKTTTLKLLTGLLKPTRGRAWLMGEPIESVRSRERLGFLPEQPYFFDHLSGLEYLEMAARLSGLPGHEATLRARHWLGRVGLGEREKLRLRKYSKGMLQRLGLASALVHGPELLVLDEPMSGLDPFGRRDVRELILEQRRLGVTVLFSSHILPDVEMLCDRVAILLHGRLQRVATVGELVGDAGCVEVRCPGSPVLEIPAAWAGRVTRADRPGETIFTVQGTTDTGPVLAWLLQQGVEVRAVTPMRQTLEDLFMTTAERSESAAERRSA